MKTVEFLKNFSNAQDALTAIEAELGIRPKVYEAEGLVVLNYDQIESPKNHPITIECRSLVLSYPSFNVVSRSFDRFFNYGEGDDKIDWSSAVAYEKADGSLIGLYNDGKNWQFRTRGTAFAESQLPSGRSYKEAILETLGLSFEKLQTVLANADKSITLLFEFISPENRIVTRYKEPCLVLLGVREKDGSFKPYMNNLEAAANVFSTIGLKNIRAPRTMVVSSADEVIKAAAELKDLEEGFVVCDKYFNRCKIKSAAYLLCHHIRGEGLSEKRIAELVAINEQDEYLTYFPEDEVFFTPYVKAREALLRIAQQRFDAANVLESQKDFALQVKDTPYSALLFTARAKRVTIEHAWADSKVPYRAELIKHFAKQMGG